MTTRIVALFTLILMAGPSLGWSQDADKPTPPPLKTLNEKASYLLGNSIGSSIVRDFEENGMEVDMKIFLQGMQTAIEGKESGFTPDEIRATLTEFQRAAAAKREELRTAQAAKNAQDGKNFLAENGKKPGVVTTNSGLQYKVLRKGEGDVPKEDSTVTVHYRGTLLNGDEFDSSYKRGEPAQFRVNEVIDGWTEALQLMRTGGKWQLFIPSNLAYGENPRPGGPIGPNEMLIFEVELLKAE